MFNSDRDLDVNSNRPVPGSHLHSLPVGGSRQYSQIVAQLSIEQSQAMPIFTQATAQAIRLIDAPVAILTAIAGSGYQIASIAGLEHFTLPINPNLALELAGLDYCHTQVASRERVFSVTNFRKHPKLDRSSLCRIQGLQAYLGVPIITAAGDLLGSISILDFKPRQFSQRDIDLLELVSRLVASEFERKLLSQSQLNRLVGDLQYEIPRFDDPSVAVGHGVEADRTEISSISPAPNYSYSVYPQVQGEIQFKLLTHLAQELRTPLTAVLGMASVLQQEIYGTLSGKQKDYVGIIHHSGQQLVTLVDEISQLGGFVGVGGTSSSAEAAWNDNLQHQQLTLKSVDLEMLCQLAIRSLEPIAHKKQQQISLDLASRSSPDSKRTNRICLLDKEKVRQIIYYLCLSLIYANAPDSEISIQLSTFSDELQIQIATNEPQPILQNLDLVDDLESLLPLSIAGERSYPTEPHPSEDLRISLGLSLSYTLAASHGGKIEDLANSRGYQLTLPLILAGDKAALA